MIISKALIWPQAYLHELNQIDKIKEMAQVNPIKPIINLYSPGICFPLTYKMRKYYDNQSSWTRIAFNPDYLGHLVHARFFTGRVLIAGKS